MLDFRCLHTHSLQATAEHAFLGGVLGSCACGNNRLVGAELERDSGTRYSRRHRSRQPLKKGQRVLMPQTLPLTPGILLCIRLSPALGTEPPNAKPSTLSESHLRPEQFNSRASCL